MSAKPPGDPGWGRPRDMVLGAFAPQLVLRRTRGSAPLLVSIRTVFVSFVTALLLIGVVVLVLSSGRSTSDGSSLAVWCAASLAIATVSVAVAHAFRRTLPCGSPEALLGAYRTRFFLRMAWNNGAAMVGFVLSFLTGSPWPYFAALPVALVGHWLTAPTWQHIADDDRRLAEQGCGTRLAPVLFPTGGSDEAPPESSTPPPPSHGPYHQP